MGYFVSKLRFLKRSFRLTISVSLDPDQARQNVGPHLAPNCLQRLSANDTAGKELTQTTSKWQKLANGYLKYFIGTV